jgi:phosphoglycolate phosphatase
MPDAASLRYETLIFDLDGTISDPFAGISRSINYALESLSYEPVDPERIRPLIGPPLTQIFEHLLGTLPDPDMQDLVDKYRERYATVGYAENKIYDGIPVIIGQLAGSGYRMGICTSKRADYAQRIIDMFGLGPHFSFVDGGGVGVEKRQQIESMIALGLTAGTAIMIGDRAIDVFAGKSNGVASAGVLWGFGERPELEDAAPDHLLESPADLLSLFLE